MQKRYNFLFALLLFTLGNNRNAGAQIMTNMGDTLTISNGNAIFITGDLSLVNDGLKHAVIKNNGIIKITGSFSSDTGTVYTGKNDSLILTGSGNQNFPGLNYGSIVVNSGGTKYLYGKAFAKYKISIRKGILNTGKDTIRMDSLATLEEDSVNYLKGNLITTRNLLAGNVYTSGNMGIELSIGNVAPGITSIFRGNGQNGTQNGFCSSGIQRYFDIKPAVNTGLAVDLIVHYWPWELNGIFKSNLEVFRSVDSGKTWLDEGTTFRNPAQFSIAINAMDTLGRFTLGSGTNPIVNALKAGKNQSICSGTQIMLGGGSNPGHNYVWSTKPSAIVKNVSNPLVTPLVNTVYYLTETVNTGNCRHTDSVVILVKPTPVATWKFSNKGPIYNFKADDSTEQTYAWDFGDGKQANGYKASHVYQKDGTYQVKLLVTGANGCSSEFDSTRDFHLGLKQETIAAIDYKIFPNPFTGSTNISFNLDHQAHVMINITDITGRNYGNIVYEKLEPGAYEFQLNANQYHLQPGIYFIKTYFDEELIVSKVVVR